MSWQAVVVIVAGMGTVVAALRLGLPFFRAHDSKYEALRLANLELAKRFDSLEGEVLSGRRLPGAGGLRR